MTHLKVGDDAPAIIATDQDGEPVSLADFLGSKVILYFYPKDDTPGCTAEACNLRDNYEGLLAAGFKILGVSVDNEKSHRKFIQKYSLPFRLIADTNKQVVKDYGVWGPKKFMGRVYDGVHRTTFVIGADGKIERIFNEVDTKNHTQQILKT